MKRTPGLNVGDRFGMLEVIGIDEDYMASRKDKRHIKYICKCDCGNITSVLKEGLTSGKTKSCGCLKHQTNKDKEVWWHDLIGSLIYRVWGNMVNRCTNKNNPVYKDYGARGITVCDEWKSFPNFYTWSIDNGYDENLTIDRIDNNKGYAPDNCRWTDMETQANNTRKNVYITHNGETKTVRQWANDFGVKYKLFWKRVVKDGDSFEEAINKPTDMKSYGEYNGIRKSMFEWAEILKTTRGAIAHRVQKGQPFNEIVEYYAKKNNVDIYI